MLVTMAEGEPKLIHRRSNERGCELSAMTPSFVFMSVLVFLGV
jgi:hypothetical protein